MTIIIGIQCTDGIVVACDSRTTETSGHVHDDAQKLSVIEFQDGNSGIVAQAGNNDLSSQAVELISRLAKTRRLDDYRGLAECARDGVKELKNKIREQFLGSAEEQQRHLEKYAFELLIANYFDSKPYVFRLDSVLGHPTKVDRPYCSIGCGWILADFIVSRLDVSKFTSATGMWTALYAVEEIKQFDAHCGGPTMAALVRCAAVAPLECTHGESSQALICRAGIAEAIDEAVDFSKSQKASWQKMANQRIDRLIQRRKTNAITKSS